MKQRIYLTNNLLSIHTHTHTNMHKKKKRRCKFSNCKNSYFKHVSVNLGTNMASI